MTEEKKRKGRHAYLNDFERDLTGKYRYCGDHYRYAGSLPRSRALGGMTALAAGALVVLLVAGLMDGPGLGRCFYVLLPYAGAFVSAICVLYTTARLLVNGDPVRGYVLEQTCGRMPVRNAVALGFAALTAVGCLVYLILEGPNWQRVAFLLLCVVATAIQVVLRRLQGRLDWEKVDR